MHNVFQLLVEFIVEHFQQRLTENIVSLSLSRSQLVENAAKQFDGIVKLRQTLLLVVLGYLIVFLTNCQYRVAEHFAIDGEVLKLLGRDDLNQIVDEIPVELVADCSFIEVIEKFTRMITNTYNVRLRQSAK